jgi:hypothetical protein
MDSGGGIFGSLKNKAKGLKNKAEDKALASFMPKMPSFGLGGLGGLFGSKGKGANPLGQVGQLGKLDGTKKGPALPPIVFKVIALITMSAFLGTFFMYINKREKDFNYDFVEKGMFVVVLLIMGLAIAYAMKFSILDFLISSEINIIATYMLIGFIVFQLGTGTSMFQKIKKLFTDLWESIKDPSSVFTKPNLLLTIIFMIIPLLVLINNATENIFLAIAVLAVSLGSVYVLYPKNNQIPFGV